MWRATFAAASIAAAAAVNNHFNFPNVQGLPKFSAAKFGLFVHWGPVSQWGTEISFPLTCNGLPCSTVGPGNKPVVINTTAQLIAHREAYAALRKHSTQSNSMQQRWWISPTLLGFGILHGLAHIAMASATGIAVPTTPIVL
jgi:hypothetical protein